MPGEHFETAKGRREGPRPLSSGFLRNQKPRIIVCILIIVFFGSAAYYSSHASESAPRTVYSTSLDEAKLEAQTPLLVNINTADAKELDELPGVGPSTAQKIIEHRRHRGNFKSVDELASVQNSENRELAFRALLFDGGAERLEWARA